MSIYKTIETRATLINSDNRQPKPPLISLIYPFQQPQEQLKGNPGPPGSTMGKPGFTVEHNWEKTQGDKIHKCISFGEIYSRDELYIMEVLNMILINSFSDSLVEGKSYMSDSNLPGAVPARQSIRRPIPRCNEKLSLSRPISTGLEKH